MPRGPKKHLKRLNAPKSWMLDKLGGIFAPRPSPGPHKLRESLPLTVVLRNRLKYALTRREVLMICARRQVKVDAKIRTDSTFPTGFMDVIQIEKTNEHFRVLYNTIGKFILHRITDKEAGFKLCRVVRIANASKASIGRNPFLHGIRSSIPYLVTNDGRTIRYPDPLVKKDDTIKLDLATGKIVDFVKFDVGNTVICTKGANVGRVGILTTRERHPGDYDIVHIQDRKGNTFTTRLNNVFVLGKGESSLVSLPRNQGVKTVSLIEAKVEKEKRKAHVAAAIAKKKAAKAK